MDEILYLLNNLLNIAAQATKLWGNCNHAYVQMLWAFAEDRRGTGYAVSTKPRNLDAKHVRSQISETHSYSAMMSRAHQKRKGRPSAHLKSFQIFATWDGERLDSTSTSRPSCLNLKKDFWTRHLTWPPYNITIHPERSFIFNACRTQNVPIKLPN